MEKFTVHTGVVAALDRPNVDTDQIIPKQFLKRIERTGFGQFLFFDWRFLESGALDPSFELNKSEATGASILLARDNFGCGSSREHAPWALADYGFQVVIAPSFADIFHNNCFQNGMLPIKLGTAYVDQLFNRAKQGRYELTVDLVNCLISDNQGLSIPFTVDATRRERLLQGLDDIGLTMQLEQKIAAYEAAKEVI